VTAPLNIFANTLRHLILCGSGDLAPAWGPVLHTDPNDGPQVNTGEWSWNPHEQRCVRRERAGYFIFDGDHRWSIPLDAASPWAARLAVTAAWMLGRSGVGVWLGDNDVFLTLNIATERNTIIQVAWHRFTGRRSTGSVPAPSLPTLPAQSAAHPPVVALLLALYDVPEIRARVDAVRS
jgi:hypothetical protein